MGALLALVVPCLPCVWDIHWTDIVRENCHGSDKKWSGLSSSPGFFLTWGERSNRYFIFYIHTEGPLSLIVPFFSYHGPFWFYIFIFFQILVSSTFLSHSRLSRHNQSQGKRKRSFFLFKIQERGKKETTFYLFFYILMKWNGTIMNQSRNKGHGKIITTYNQQKP